MQIIVNLLNTVSIVLIAIISFSCSYYPTKFFHIAHAATITLGAYITYALTSVMPLPIAIPLSIIATTGIGILCEILIYRPMRRKGLSSLSLMIASIGLYTVLQNSISMIFGDDTKTLRIGEVKVGHEIGGAYITDIQIVTIIVSALLFVGMLVFQKTTILGKSLRAVSTNPELSNIYGINADKVILWAFGIGSALGAVAGILSALDTNMTPTMGFNLLLYGVVAMIIGGVGSTRGLIGGALLVASAQHLAAYYIDTKWMDAVAYLILILFLIWKPLGFSGNRLKKVEI